MEPARVASRSRMTAAERAQQLLRAAVTAFARGGYTGTTTDQVARLAGVSQPYVLRVFGSKQALFLAVHQHASARIQDAFRAAAATVPPGAEVSDRLAALGCAYLRLAADHELLLVVQHGFMAAEDPGLGPAMRRCMADIHRLVGALTGADAQQIRDFIARGVLINTVVALRMSEHLDGDPDAAQLVHHALRSPADCAAARSRPDPRTAHVRTSSSPHAAIPPASRGEHPRS